MAKKKKKLTKQEIAAAIQKFHQNGGIIKKLPDQRYAATTVVGEEKHQVYESIHAFSSLL